MKKFALCLMFLTVTLIQGADTNSLEFMEAFAWGDRESALKELVPDTEDYYYYHCLHYQLSGDRRAFQTMLDRWLKHNKNRWNTRMYEMRRRQALIEFDRAPDQTWDRIRSDAGLYFNHRKRNEARQSNYPSVVQPDRYSLNAFIQEAKNYGGFLNNVTPRGLELIGNQDLNPDRRRSYLGQLQRPDISGLVDMIVADLRYKDSRGFGHHSIHNQLTLAQLEDLGRKMPELLRDQRYITERISRIQPPEVDLSHDHEAAIGYYQTLWAFVETLSPVHNSLKAGTLYNLLDHQRKTGVYDEELFKTYLALPRSVYYLDRDLRNQLNRQRAQWVNFNYSPGRGVILPPIRNEEPLVKDFLLRLLKDDPDMSGYHPLFETGWLRAVFAESKILNGIGKPEAWAHLLSPQAYQQILERIEINFAPENPSYLHAGDEVNLQVDLKRVDSLLVKIYEMQTFNYYTTYRAPVDQAVDLDGMIPTYERTLDVSADPGRRVRRSLAFPEIKDRGVYVVELIGNGVSSRALLHVGHLETISQPTVSGQIMMVLNDAGETVKDAAIWLNEKEYTANDKGLILLPFSENPGVRFVVLRDGDFSSPEQIQHLGEAYSFNAGIHIDRQSLNRRSTGKLVLRPDLRIHGIPINPSLLKNVNVTLVAVDAKGTRSEREYPANFDLYSEWAEEFYVPDGLRQLEVQVEATIKRKTDLEDMTLSDSYVLNVNGGRTGDQLRQVFLSPSLNGWSLEVRGLNGESIAGEPLNIQFQHPGFTRRVRSNVTTDEEGNVELGPLTGLASIHVSGKDLNLNMPLAGGLSTYPNRIHLEPGEQVSLPYPWDRKADLQAASLFKKGRGLNLEDVGEKVAIQNGQLVIEGLEEGLYELTLHESGAVVTLEVLDGESRSGFLLGNTRRLQETATRLPSIVGVDRAGDGVSVRLRHVTPSTRVAVRAFRYAGPGGAFPLGQGFASASNRTLYPPHTQYVSGREIGDEYRYVLERKFKEVFAGTLLERPGLILNPWMLRETTAEQERLKQDQAYRGERQQLNAPVPAPSAMNEGGFADGFGGGGGGAQRDRAHFLGDVMVAGRKSSAVSRGIGFDFLPQGSQWWVNLEPEKDGTVKIPLEGLGEHTALDIVVVDRFGTTRTRQVLPDEGFEPAQVRLANGLNPDRNFSRQKTVRRIDAKTPVVFPDLATTRYQVIRDFAQAYDLLQTLSGDARLVKFAFLKNWSELKEDEKLEKYGEFASHELHLFLYERDRKFFDSVVKPYLQNKKDKTFVDRWLLDDLLLEDTRLDYLQDRNALELALLARRGGDAEVLQAALREAQELLPPDPDGFSRRVQVALQANELDEVASLARDERRELAEGKSESLNALMSNISSPVVMGQSRRSAVASKMAMPAAEMSADMSFAMKEAEVMMDDAEGMDRGQNVSESDLFGAFGEQAQRLYRALPKTKEWAEQNYYEVRAREDLPARLSVNEFWLDVASGVEVSSHLMQSHRNLTDVLTALAFCGLPDEAEAPEEKPDEAALTLSVTSPAILVTEQILPAEASEDDRPLLLSQQFFRPDDMYRFEGNERIEKFVTGEFIRRTVYGARVTLTNPTASRRRMNVLMQIPVGAIPLRNGFYTDDRSVLLEPYTTQTVEYFFMFPESGTYGQFPAHASAKEAVIGQAEPRVFDVKDAPTEVDKTSWAWISQYGSERDTLAYLEEHNLRRVELDDMAWRLKDKAFFNRSVDLLISRGFYHDTTFSYGVFHKDTEIAKVWLANSSLARQVGPVLESPLLVVDPVETKTYEHLEYDPLVNPRAHDVGAKRKILNLALRDQYRSFLHHNLYRNKLGASEKLALVYYLQLQDRLGEAFEQLAGVESDDAEEQLQLDYLNAWMALRKLDMEDALALARPHVNHPVPRWRNRFASVVQAVEESRGAEVADQEDPTRQQDLDQLAASEPSIELQAISGKLMVTAHHLTEVTLNLYPMDIELLFSRKPFLAEGGQDFAVIKPALTRMIEVKGKGEEEELLLPEEFRDQNLMVELTGKGKRASVAWYANQLKVRKMENFGQVEVRSAKTNRPLPKTYIKVFAKSEDGRVSFWKDGYTDLRGRFDYVSLNDRQPEEAAEFSILILHPELGAEIKQAEPPTR